MKRSFLRRLCPCVPVWGLPLAFFLSPAARAAEPPNACLDCHEPPSAALKASVHEKMTCVACHGGDARPRADVPDDIKKAKAHAANAAEPFLASPEAKCARCHKSDAETFARGTHGLTFRSRAAVNCKQCHAKDLNAPSAHAVAKLSFTVGAIPGRPRTGIDSTFVHRIGLFDAKKRPIDAKSYEPYSPAATCGRCHDYATIAMGRHFQAGRPGAEDGRPGEPWLLWDAATQTQIPLSHRAWTGTRKPAELGMTSWDFALRFGPHHPGGGVLEWAKEGQRRDAAEEPGAGGKPASRWRSGGAMEIDCLACHLAAPYSREDRAFQVANGFFRFGPEAAAGFGAIKPGVRKETDDGDEYFEPAPPPVPKAAPAAPAPGAQTPAAPTPAAPAPKPPAPPAPGEGVFVAVRDAARFDADGRVQLDITRRPPVRNCLFCHATRTPGTTGGASADCDRDVHVAAGLGCTECHRNTIDHQIARGDGGALDGKHHPENATLSCQGCHATGRLGAPAIPHRGLPGFHLEKLACTTCHGGPFPDSPVQANQTARAHGLGLIARDDLDGRTSPAVLAPVYKPDAEGKIRPHYALWPAWWGERKEGKIAPLSLARVKEAIEAARRDAGKPDASPDALAVLAKLKEKGNAEPVRVAGGRIYTLQGGALASEEGPEAEAYAWPVAHNVRSAQQALGAHGCSDCHSSVSPFFFGTVTATPAGPDGRAEAKPMYRYLGLSPAAIRLGAAAVVMREGGMAWIAVLLVLGLLAASLAHVAAGIRVARLLGVPETAAAGPAPDLGAPLRWLHFCAWALFLALAATGAGFLITYGPSPLPNFFSSRQAVKLHVAAGLTFAVLASLLALAWLVVGVAKKRGADWVNAWGGFLWMARGRGDGSLVAWDTFWVWIDLLCCLALAATGIIMAMRVPSVGALAGGLRHLPDHHLIGPLAYAVHGMAGSAMVGRLVAHLYSGLFLRKRS